MAWTASTTYPNERDYSEEALQVGLWVLLDPYRLRGQRGSTRMLPGLSHRDQTVVYLTFEATFLSISMNNEVDEPGNRETGI